MTTDYNQVGFRKTQGLDLIWVDLNYQFLMLKKLIYLI